MDSFDKAIIDVSFICIEYKLIKLNFSNSMPRKCGSTRDERNRE